MGSARTVRRWGGHGGRVNAVGFGGEGGGVVVSGEWVMEGDREGKERVLVGWRGHFG